MGNGGSSSSKKAHRNGAAFNNMIRVVHLSGSLHVIEAPITVAQLLSAASSTATKKKHYFLCTPAQLLSGTMEPLKLHVQLQPGHIYFLLPFSSFNYEVSRLDLAVLAKRLTAAARSKRTTLCTCTTAAAATTTTTAATAPTEKKKKKSRVMMMDRLHTAQADDSSNHHHQPWRPELETIAEATPFILHPHFLQGTGEIVIS